MQVRFKSHKLKALRASRGMGQEELALKSGLSRPTIQRLEAGITDSPSLNTLQALAEVFDISVTALFSDEAIQIQ